MKLSLIASENIINKVADKKLHGSRLLNRAALHTRKPYDGNSGHDSADRATGTTYLPSGIPHKKRHRTYFGVSKKGNQLKENHADGKKPGRKGLAKRMGVDCKQPISKLRKVAKNSTGEKRTMAHWCANMKSGKKKANKR